MRNKLIESLREELFESDVYAEDDKVVITLKDGSKEKWVPKDMTAQEVVDKFYGIKKHSEGRAWQWLKKVEKADPDKVEELHEEYDEHTECPYLNKVAFLANDEDEAIKGYEEAVALFNTSDLLNKDDIIDRLQHIKNEELEHIRELTTIRNLLHVEEIPQDPTKETKVTVKDSTEVEEKEEEKHEIEGYPLPINSDGTPGITESDKEESIQKIEFRVSNSDYATADELEDDVTEFVKFCKTFTDEPKVEDKTITVFVNKEVVPGFLSRAALRFPKIKHNEIISEDQSREEIISDLEKETFTKYDDVEDFFTKKGYEVYDAYKEGEGFNVVLHKSGEEWYVPFTSQDGHFVAVFDGSTHVGGVNEESSKECSCVYKGKTKEEWIKYFKDGGLDDEDIQDKIELWFE